MLTREQEIEIFGCSNQQISQYLLSLWGFDDRMVEAVRYQYHPWMQEIKDEVSTADVMFLSEMLIDSRFINNHQDVNVEFINNYFSEKNIDIDKLINENISESNHAA